MMLWTVVNPRFYRSPAQNPLNLTATADTLDILSLLSVASDTSGFTTFYSFL